MINTTIYNLSQFPCNCPTLTVGGKKFFFNEGLKLSKLEELYFQNNDSELKKYSNELLKNVLSDEEGVSTDYHKLGQEAELVELILCNIFKKNKKESKTVKPLIFQEKNSCLIEKLFNQDCFIWQGRIYSLNKGGVGLYSIRLKDQDYSIGEHLKLNLEDLEKKYLKSIEENIFHQLTKGKEALFNKLEKLKEKKEIIDIIKRGEFYNPVENQGIEITDKGVFVTTRVKPYILYEPKNKKYYRFGEAVIGVKLVKQDSLVCWKDPVVINPYIHPALPSKEAKPYQKICNGKLDYNQLTEGKSLEEAVRLLLSEAERMIISGYFGKKEVKGAWYQLTEYQFQNLEVKDFNPREVTNR